MARRSIHRAAHTCYLPLPSLLDPSVNADTYRDKLYAVPVHSRNHYAEAAANIPTNVPVDSYT